MTLTTKELQHIVETDHVQCGDAAAMAKELLASREAVPVALVDRRPAESGSICWQNGGKDLPHGTELFTAPPAPENVQPESSREHFESLCNQFWNWALLDEITAGEEEPRLLWDGKKYTHRITAALWRIYQSAPPAPAVPDEITSADAPEIFEIAAEVERLGLRGTYGVYAAGWNACRAAMLQLFGITERLPAAP